MRSSAGADGGASRDRRQRSNDAGRHGEECRLLAPCDSSSLPCLSDLPGSTNRRPGSPILRRASPPFVRHWYAPYLPGPVSGLGGLHRTPNTGARLISRARLTVDPGALYAVASGALSCGERARLRRASSISPVGERSTAGQGFHLDESTGKGQVAFFAVRGCARSESAERPSRE